MKYQWEEEDIICGRFVCKHPSYQKQENFSPTGNAMKWTYKIGFAHFEDGPYKVLIAMTDGKVSKLGKTDQEAVDKLNKDEMIPMPHKWLVAVINELRDTYEGN